MGRLPIADEEHLPSIGLCLQAAGSTGGEELFVHLIVFLRIPQVRFNSYQAGFNGYLSFICFELFSAKQVIYSTYTSLMRSGVFARIAAQIEPNRNHQCSQCEVANARPMPRMPINSGLSRLTIRVDSSLIPTSLTKTSCRQAFASSERLRLSLLRLSATQLPLYASKRFLAVRIDAFQGLPDFSEAASSLDQFPRLAVSARISIGAVAHPSTETFAVAILSVVPVRAVHAVGAIPSRRIHGCLRRVRRRARSIRHRHLVRRGIGHLHRMHPGRRPLRGSRISRPRDY